MSSTATPSQPTRGVLVPGIDTNNSTSFTGWPLTPQSVDDSRGPSSAYSCFSDAYNSTPSPVNGFSQPPTPVNNMQHPVEMLPLAYPSPLYAVSGSGNARHFNTSATYNHALDAFRICPSNDSPVKTDWTHVRRSTLDVGLHTHEGLRETLFQSAPGLTQEAVRAYSHSSSSTPGPLEAFPFSNFDATSIGPSFHQPLQVVVPSQLGRHEDFLVDQSTHFEHHDIQDGCAQFFSSAADPRDSSWECVDPPTPMGAYFSQADDEAYSPVKSGARLNPSVSASTYRPRRFASILPGQQRSRQRTSKRSRKTGNECKAWFQQEVAGTIVRYEGARFDIDADECGRLNVVPAEMQVSKPHRCRAMREDGKACTSRFERSEHLKRHMASHTKERKYVCPIPNCKSMQRGGIARPDNACDHFKTHLRKSAKGKRNMPHNWSFLQPLLWKAYDEKTAQKLVTNLRKWLWTENLKTDVGKEIPNFPLMHWHRMEAEMNPDLVWAD